MTIERNNLDFLFLFNYSSAHVILGIHGQTFKYIFDTIHSSKQHIYSLLDNDTVIDQYIKRRISSGAIRVYLGLICPTTDSSYDDTASRYSSTGSIDSASHLFCPLPLVALKRKLQQKSRESTNFGKTWTDSHMCRLEVHQH